MTFEEFWRKRVEMGLDPYCTSDIELARFVWNAAKEDSKPLADIFYVDYLCAGVVKNGGPYWTVRGTSATVIVQTKEEAEEWAIKNGYRIEE